MDEKMQGRRSMNESIANDQHISRATFPIQNGHMNELTHISKDIIIMALLWSALLAVYYACRSRHSDASFDEHLIREQFRRLHDAEVERTRKPKLHERKKKFDKKTMSGVSNL